MVLSMERWVGKVAVVTGASAGIGAAITEHLALQGVIVVGLARRKERIDELSKKIAGKGKVYGIKCDLTKEEDILNAFKWVKLNLGPVHILINNAGILQPTILVDGDTEMWRRIFDVNVVALCIATREAIRDMRANNVDGHIIHINSIFGHKVPCILGLNVEPASKFAITALTETLRLELNSFQSKINISSISPGAVGNTEIAEANNIDVSKMNIGIIPELQKEDVVDAVIYTLSTPPHVQVHELMIKPVNEPF